MAGARTIAHYGITPTRGEPGHTAPPVQAVQMVHPSSPSQSASPIVTGITVSLGLIGHSAHSLHPAGALVSLDPVVPSQYCQPAPSLGTTDPAESIQPGTLVPPSQAYPGGVVGVGPKMPVMRMVPVVPIHSPIETLRAGPARMAVCEGPRTPRTAGMAGTLGPKTVRDRPDCQNGSQEP
jgi:hypothetical protein